MRKLLSILCVLAVVHFSATSVRAATTYYVAPQGSDSNAGSQSAPFLTIQKAVDGIAPGDTVIVKDGTYAGAEVSKGGNASAWVTIKSENKGGAKIVSPQQHGKHGFYFYPSANYINVYDFDISGGQAAFMSDEGGHDLNIKGNTVHDVGRFCTDNTIGLVGMYMESSTNITVEANTFKNIGRFSPGESGCQPKNEFYKNHDHGLYINGSSNVLVKNNIFIDFNHGWGIQIYSGSGERSQNIKIYNNTFAFDNPDKIGQIILAGRVEDTEIKNNIFYQPRTAAIDFFEPVLSNVTVNTNIVSGAPMVSAYLTGITMSYNKENTDALLVNPGSGDFALQPSSPAVNAGETLSAVPVDFDGRPRPQGSGYDLGAMELVSGLVSPSPSPSVSPSPSLNPSPSPSQCMPADINADGVVNLMDYSILASQFMKDPLTILRADINGDGVVNVFDYSILVTYLMDRQEC